jgi:hypothetical protein
VTENDAPHSGSRWEPHPWDGVHPPSDPTPALPSAATAAAEGTATGRRTGWARRGVLAGAGAGILVIGGVGGFAAGHAFAGSDGAGIPAGGGHFDRHDGGDRFDGVPPGGGSAPDIPSAGNGSTPGRNA